MQPYDVERQKDIDAEWEEKQFEITNEDRYLLNHPGPDWRTKPRLSERERALATEHTERLKRGEAAWDEEQFSGLEEFDIEPYKKIPVSASTESVIGEKITETGPYLCLICRAAPAFWPREIAWRRALFGLRFQILFRTPFCCTFCRVFRQSKVKTLGQQDYRPIWKRILALAQGEIYPTASPRMAKLIRWRNWLALRGWG